VGGERQTLIDVELKRTEFRLDVLKLRERLAAIGVRRGTKKSEPAAVVTTPAGTTAEPAGEAPASTPVPAKPAPAPAASA
jgi:hypothetical protein